MKYKNPFLPSSRGDLAIIDGRVSEEVEKSLIEKGYTVVRTVKCETTYEAVSYHPDMVLHPVNGKEIVVAPEVYDYYRDALSHYGFKIIKGEKELEKNYPGNVGYNVGRVGNLAIHNTRYTDEVLKYYLDKEGVEWVYVKQGYSKCSTLTVGEWSIITSDKGIDKALRNRQDVEVCLIEAGGILLEGMDYGFIGGCGGMMSKGELFITGSHGYGDSGEKMNSFLEKKGIVKYEALDSCAEDIGSIIFLDSREAKGE